MATDRSLPTLQIKLSMSSDTYSGSVQNADELPRMEVETTLLHSQPITLDIRGEFRSETVLEDAFRFQHFEWYDLTTAQTVENNDFENVCDPWVTLDPQQVLTLHPNQPLVTSRLFDEISPLCDPLFKVNIGHQYQLTLKPQMVWWTEGRKEDLFGGKDALHVGDLPTVPLLSIASEDKVVFTVVS